MTEFPKQLLMGFVEWGTVSICYFLFLLIGVGLLMFVNKKRGEKIHLSFYLTLAVFGLWGVVFSIEWYNNFEYYVLINGSVLSLLKILTLILGATIIAYFFFNWHWSIYKLKKGEITPYMMEIIELAEDIRGKVNF